MNETRSQLILRIKEQDRLIKYLRGHLVARAPIDENYALLLKAYQKLLVKNVELQDSIDDLERYITWTGETSHPMRRRE